jgi:nicotinate-nucleotide adenylyltransferase
LDPVHHGHLFAAEEVRARFELERVLFIPCGHAPHKDERGRTPAEHRLRMCVLATASNPCFEVSRIEIDRPGPSYTIDTLRQVRAIRGADTELFFILGADALLEIDTWRLPDAVLAEARCIAVPRPGSELTGLASVIGEERASRVEVVPLLGLDISATDIRRRVREGRPIRYLTPDSVVDYIGREGLYIEAGSS